MPRTSLSPRQFLSIVLLSIVSQLTDPVTTVLCRYSSFIVCSEEEKNTFQNPGARQSAKYLRVQDGGQKSESEADDFELREESLRRLKDKVSLAFAAKLPIENMRHYLAVHSIPRSCHS